MTFKEYLSLHTTLAKSSQRTYCSALKSPRSTKNNVRASAMRYYKAFLALEQASIQRQSGNDKTGENQGKTRSYVETVIAKSRPTRISSDLNEILSLPMEETVLLHLIMAYCQGRMNEQK